MARTSAPESGPCALQNVRELDALLRLLLKPASASFAGELSMGQPPVASIGRAVLALAHLELEAKILRGSDRLAVFERGFPLPSA